MAKADSRTAAIEAVREVERELARAARLKSASERVLGWQTRLHRWAVQDEQARFGDLLNLICDPATLFVAWDRVKRNRGSRTAGVDGITRKHIEQAGVENVLGELRQSLRDRTYTPLPVREHEIPKRGSGKVRKLGIPPLRDSRTSTVHG